jgi:hypothetical protein
MPYVEIPQSGGVEYDTYIDLADADIYLAAQITATGWAAATPDQRSAAIVSMTRTINRQTWQGKPSDGFESAAWMAFPRSGLVYRDGSPVDPTTVPQEVIDATCEGASYMLNGVPIQDESSTFNPTKIIKAGSVMLESFRLIEPLPRFQPAVQELIGQWLGGGPLATGAESSGTEGRSVMKEQYNVNQGF